MQCHYEVLGIARDADAVTIKKAHRSKAMQYHPDKNRSDPEGAAEVFRLVQEAYECLSDPSERRWYDDHRDALLKGWAAGGTDEHDQQPCMLFNVIPYMHAHCYAGYNDAADAANKDKNFFTIYRYVFASIAKEEGDDIFDTNDQQQQIQQLPSDFGNSQTPLREVAAFYQAWEGFVSRLSYAWADKYDLGRDADHRRIRRAMEDENKKARKLARKARNEEIVALVRFVKRRDPRFAAWKEQQEQLQAQRHSQMAANKQRKKQEAAHARKEWREQAELEQAELEELDRLAGRVRLADLEDEDDYEYAGKKRKGKKKKGRNNNNDNDNNDNNSKNHVPELQEQDDPQDTEQPQNDTEDQQNGADDDEPLPQSADNGEEEADDICSINNSESSSEEQEEEEQPDFWRCECCKKDFKSQGQMDNHMKSKKHKEAYKKFQKNMAQ